jgi:hypothetical protein
MKPHLLLGPVAVVLGLFVVSGTPSAARADACVHTDVVFYSTAPGVLAPELGKFASSCADYYISVPPRSAGPPNPAPVAAIRLLGPRFHAMAEIRLKSPYWSGYAAVNGWYATGVEVRRQMAAAGYDVSLGDTWAVNEVGEPSATQMGVDVIKGVGTARGDFRDLVRGLYTGDDGTPNPGLVFAADPLQVTSDLSQYKQDLLSWYGDSDFWNDMSSYVRFWAQETYADARLWGVDGSTLAERSARLNDYFQHGNRLAVAGAPGTDEARAFFANAYTPLANASFRWPPPNVVTGIGFGYTDIGLDKMLQFVSTQTYAQRLAATPSTAGERLGFAVAANNATGAETTAVYDRLAAAVQASENTPAGACGANGAWCDSTVDGAWFSDTWKTFTDATPPTLQLPQDIVVDATSPTGAIATFTVSATDTVDADPVIECTHASGALFPIGTTTVTCTATDDVGYTTTGSFTVHVRGADEQLVNLAVDVRGVGPGSSLADKLTEARAALDAGDPAAAAVILQAFAHEVRAQQGKKIPAGTATMLLDAAARMRAVLGY